MEKFTGCTVVSCVRQMDIRVPKVRANYQIEEMCRYAKDNSCTYRRKMTITGGIK